MHSNDPGKLSGPLFDRFWSEFEGILEAAGDQAAHLDRFVFPTLTLKGRQFFAFCSFLEATFSRGVDFRDALFTKSADSTGASFAKNAIFSGTRFEQRVTFNKATFAQHATFLGTTFTLTARFSGVEFKQNANFRRAAFRRTARFSDIKFVQKANFSNATFAMDAIFRRAIFKMNAGLSNVLFERHADFHQASFLCNGSFFSSRFAQSADFTGATFAENSDFRGSAFARSADFSRATFMQDASFHSASFTQNADFSDVTFSKDASFSKSNFTQNANFNKATFGSAVAFGRATFSEIADFSDATFSGIAGFQLAAFQDTTQLQRSRFLDRAEFRGTKFAPETEGAPGAVFALARFSKPQEIIFDDVILDRVLFHDCDVSAIGFTSSVRWARRSGNRGVATFDETIPLENGYAAGLLRDGQRDLSAVAQIYQQLKKNYDSRLDYWTANEFHFGEMEMKRLELPDSGRFLRLRRWLRPWLSPVAFYRHASDYGNSYWRPIVWLICTLLLFAVLLPIPGAGLKRQPSGQTQTYTTIWDKKDHWLPNIDREVKIEAKAGIAAVDTAAFQRNAEYAPAYPCGRVLAIVTNLITSTLFALFLLALRRQFKR